MKIRLDSIQSSPYPIRKTWDEEKMKELSWSLLEEGQVEPIGVYDNGDSYVVVWGHRRIEAARRAGWSDIDAILVPQDEIDNLVQAGIENLSGEEMTADDKAEWAQRLVNLGFSQHEIARRTSIPLGTINQWLQSAKNMPGVYARNQHKDEVVKTVKIAQVSDDLSAKKTIADKVSKEGLTQLQTTEVARAYRDAPTYEVKQMIVASPILSNDTASDILRRSTARVKLEKVSRVQAEGGGNTDGDKQAADLNFSLSIKEFLNVVEVLRKKIHKVVSKASPGGTSRAALRYAIRNIDELIGELQACKAHLEALE
jgi:ParB family chromosome partitioning protein